MSMGQKARQKARRRRSRNAGDAADAPFDAGLWGALSPGVSRSDLRLIARAVRDGWPVSPESRPALVRLVADQLGSAYHRNKLAAASAIIAAEQANPRRIDPPEKSP